MSHIDKVAIIGLDTADPTLVFEQWPGDLPNLRRLAATGLSGRLTSCLPPTAVPAWSCMATSKDPGALGVYGPRNRRDWTYENLGLATNLEVRQPRLWDHIARAGLESIIVGVPQTFPIVRPPRGCQITGPLTPSTDSPYTHPPELADEIEKLVREYVLDVVGFQSGAEQATIDRIHRMADQRFAISRRLLTTRPWNLFWMVETGVDRIQHGCWQFMDAEHRWHEPGSPFASAIHDHYVYVDRQIGKLLDALDLEETAVWVVSPYGAQRREGGFCLNDWLIREGLLTMRTPVSVPRAFELADVDWTRTKVWADGGQSGQCYVNQAGREPLGIVPEHDVGPLCDELSAKIEALTDHEGRPMGNRVFKPRQTYGDLASYPPELIVLFGELRWSCLGGLGHSDLHVFDSGAGLDGANHTMEGMYILSHGSLEVERRYAALYDVLPTTLECLGLPVPRGAQGQSLLGGGQG